VAHLYVTSLMSRSWATGARSVDAQGMCTLVRCPRTKYFSRGQGSSRRPECRPQSSSPHGVAMRTVPFPSFLNVETVALASSLLSFLSCLCSSTCTCSSLILSVPSCEMRSRPDFPHMLAAIWYGKYCALGGWMQGGCV
jgi:hypothetical protein